MDKTGVRDCVKKGYAYHSEDTGSSPKGIAFFVYPPYLSNKGHCHVSSAKKNEFINLKGDLYLP